eukprot:COSAG06_NODE_1684_length_8722_cov_3.925896_6_plen_42_part_00
MLPQGLLWLDARPVATSSLLDESKNMFHQLSQCMFAIFFHA